MSDGTASTRRGIPARTLWLALGAIVLIAAIALVAWLLLRTEPEPMEPPAFVGFSADSTATAGFAGQFPAPPAPALARPSGMEGDGDRLYVALSEAGAIAVFDYEGAHIETITLTPAPGAAAVAPIDLALLEDGGLLVVDTAARRVVRLAEGASGEDAVPFGPTTGEGAPGQPTAVCVAADRVFIADAEGGAVREYDLDGTYLGDVVFVDPAPSFVGDLLAARDTLYVSDSNAGRVVLVDLGASEQRSVVQRRLSLPRGLETDPEGNLFVAEAFGGRVSLFDPTGQTVLDIIGESGTERLGAGGVMGSPESLVWDEGSSRLYVTDTAQGRVKVYNFRPEVR